MTPPGLRERKKERTRRDIQRHAMGLIEEQGYAATTVEQIAAAAEVSPSTFFRYFRNKDEAVVADIMDERTFEEMVAAPAELDPLQALAHGLRRTMESLSDEEWEREIRRNRLIRSVPELRRGLLEEFIRPMRLVVEAVGQRLGRPATDPTVQVFGGALLGGLVAPFLQDDGPGDIEPPATREEAVRRFEEAIGTLSGLLHPPA
ncbi:Transcriptional regulator, TetR family protein [Nostocoides japonicum T1-X7]|uniref:Transcriptional regulator, TetR family protein n=1 Tax=Nostocoides japonicum T1-X7 TaxID=1194083 RepID=A0A077LTF1_9MICO|nr:TetR family transcriptional regulator [Tetrasphaera japonica]CCH76466.1 Transcriptional regulator, TetR family protein [Tetrasphaera japonica T1-X7]